MIAGAGMFYDVVVNRTSEEKIIIFILLIFVSLLIVVGVYLIFFARDEQLEFEKRKHTEMKEEKIEKERLEKETHKVELVYKPLKKYLSSNYLGEIRLAFNMISPPSIAGIKLSEMLSHYDKESIILLSIPEENRLQQDVKDLYRGHVGKMIYYYGLAIKEGNDSQIVKGLAELVLDVEVLIDKLDRKIADPLSEYGVKPPKPLNT